jgi:hypothetical protein
MLLSLSRRRSLRVGIIVAVALVGLGAPALAATQGHCSETLDQHCQPALPQVGPVPLPTPSGLVESCTVTDSAPVVVIAILKVPLAD